jgi:hypothetical protein
MVALSGQPTILMQLVGHSVAIHKGNAILSLVDTTSPILDENC